MHLYFEVGRKDEKKILQILNVPFDVFSLVPIGPSHDDIQGVTLFEDPISDCRTNRNRVCRIP